jgi:hypothetical protein
MKWLRLLPTPRPERVGLLLETLPPSGDFEAWPMDWVRRHSVRGGWVQLTDQVLARRPDDPSWFTPAGEPVEQVSGHVLSAEGVDADGRLWRLRWMDGRPTVCRLTEDASGMRALRFERRYISSWSPDRSPLPMTVREYWTEQPQPSLQCPGGSGLRWAPYVACFAAWGA